MGARLMRSSRLAGFGFFQAWIYFAALSPAFLSSNGAYVGGSPGAGMLLSAGLCASMAGLTVLNMRWSIFDRPRLLILSSLLAGAGTLLMSLPEGGGFAAIGVMLADCGTAMLFMYWGRFWTEVDLDRMSMHLTVSSLFSCVLYCVLALLPSWAIAVAVAALPLCSSAALLACKNEPRRERGSMGDEVLPSTRKLVVVIVAVPLAYSLVRAFYAQGSLALFGEPYRKVMMAFAFFALTLLVALVVMGKPRIGRLYRLSITLIMLGLISQLALPVELRWFALAAVMLGYSVFSELVWLMRPEIEVRIGAFSGKAFGWNRTVLHASAFAGMALGTWLLHQPDLSSVAVTVASMLMTMLIVVVAVNVLPEREFMLFVHPIKVEECAPMSADSGDAVAAACERMAKRHGLSRRELDVLLLLARGRTLPYIESQLFISNSTARTHARNIYRKLDVHTKQALINMVESECEQGGTAPIRP